MAPHSIGGWTILRLLGGGFDQQAGNCGHQLRFGIGLLQDQTVGYAFGGPAGHAFATDIEHGKGGISLPGMVRNGPAVRTVPKSCYLVSLGPPLGPSDLVRRPGRSPHLALIFGGKLAVP